MSSQGRRLLTGGRAFRDRRCQHRCVDEDRALHQRGRQVVVRDRHAPAAATGREADDAEVVPGRDAEVDRTRGGRRDRKSTRLNSSHDQISYAVFCLKKKKRVKRTYIEHYINWRIARSKLLDSTRK